MPIVLLFLFVFQQDSEFPLVVVGIFIQQPTPFVTVFFERLLKLQYPKNRLKLFIYNQVRGEDKTDQVSPSVPEMCCLSWKLHSKPIQRQKSTKRSTRWNDETKRARKKRT